MRNLRKVTFGRIGQALFNGVVTHLPSLMFNDLKIRYLELLGSSVGTETRLGNHLKVLGPKNLKVGDGVALAHNVVLDARGGLDLRAGALIGFESVLLTYTHASDDPNTPVHRQGVVEGPIVVGENTWIGARCLVLPNVFVGDSAIVGAMSVVSRDVPSSMVVAGIPARELRQR